MIHDKQQRPAPRNSIEALDVDVPVVPTQRDTRNRAKQNVHLYTRRTDRSGTPRRMNAEITNIATTVITAAR